MSELLPAGMFWHRGVGGSRCSFRTATIRPRARRFASLRPRLRSPCEKRRFTCMVFHGVCCLVRFSCGRGRDGEVVLTAVAPRIMRSRSRMDRLCRAVPSGPTRPNWRPASSPGRRSNVRQRPGPPVRCHHPPPRQHGGQHEPHQHAAHRATHARRPKPLLLALLGARRPDHAAQVAHRAVKLGPAVCRC
jgi:hypothetical protein